MENNRLSLEELNKIDSFSLFKVSENARDEEIKKAYYRIANFYHPDINTEDKDTNEKMKLVNLAFEKIKDKEKRTNYIRTKYNEEKRAYADFCKKRQAQQTSSNQNNFKETKSQEEQRENYTERSQEIQIQKSNKNKEDSFEEFLNSKGQAYREIYEMYFEELMALDIDSVDKRSADQAQINQTIRNLALEYTENYIGQVSPTETNRSK